MNNLKILDISNLDWNDHIRIRQLVNELSVSCETSGFFYLKVSDEFGQTCIEMLQIKIKGICYVFENHRK